SSTSATRSRSRSPTSTSAARSTWTRFALRVKRRPPPRVASGRRPVTVATGALGTELTAGTACTATVVPAVTAATGPCGTAPTGHRGTDPVATSPAKVVTGVNPAVVATGTPDDGRTVDDDQ